MPPQTLPRRLLDTGIYPYPTRPWPCVFLKAAQQSCHSKLDIKSRAAALPKRLLGPMIYLPIFVLIAFSAFAQPMLTSS
jgi:hypothetical protein